MKISNKSETKSRKVVNERDKETTTITTSSNQSKLGIYTRTHTHGWKVRTPGGLHTQDGRDKGRIDKEGQSNGISSMLITIHDPCEVDSTGRKHWQWFQLGLKSGTPRVILPYGLVEIRRSSEYRMVAWCEPRPQRGLFGLVSTSSDETITMKA